MRGLLEFYKGNNNPICALLPCTRNTLCNSIHNSKLGLMRQKAPRPSLSS